MTVFSLQEDFNNSSNPGFLVKESAVQIRLKDRTWQLELSSEGEIAGDLPEELTSMAQIIRYTHQHHHYLLGSVEE